MSITNYSELTAALESWSHRADLTDLLPDFVILAEKRIYHGDVGSPPLRLMAMQAQDTGSSSNGSISLPTRYLQTIRLGITSAGVTKTIDYIPPNQFSQFETSGETYKYTILSGTIKLGYTTGGSYVHDYYRSYPALTSTDNTNDLLTNHPHLYLWAGLTEIELWANNEKGIALYSGRLASAINSLHSSDRYSMAGGSLSVRPS